MRPDPDTVINCRLCNRAKRPDEAFVGKRMWHHWQPTCGHGDFFTCPDCGPTDQRIRCSVCGSGSFYC